MPCSTLTPYVESERLITQAVLKERPGDAVAQLKARKRRGMNKGFICELIWFQKNRAANKSCYNRNQTP